ncbi:MAG: hypothetical protein ACRDJC_17105 [Thermomicrobiales bacterium]
MKRLIIVAFGLAVGLGSALGGVSVRAQSGPIDYDDASGDSGTCTVSGPPGDTMIMCTDLRPGDGVAVVNAGTEPAPDPAAEVPAPAPEAAPEAAAPPETTDRAVATATDQDADNYADELEPGLGLDPTNADTDADGVADGDELNIYGTDPLAVDSDGDGVFDGEELFGIMTDPLVWEDFGPEGGETGAG